MMYATTLRFRTVTVQLRCNSARAIAGRVRMRSNQLYTAGYQDRFADACALTHDQLAISAIL